MVILAALNRIFVRLFWIRSEADGSRYAGKATLLWEKEINNIENKFIFGYDYETSDTEQMNFDQVP